MSHSRNRRLLTSYFRSLTRTFQLIEETLFWMFDTWARFKGLNETSWRRQLEEKLDYLNSVVIECDSLHESRVEGFFISWLCRSTWLVMICLLKIPFPLSYLFEVFDQFFVYAAFELILGLIRNVWHKSWEKLKISWKYSENCKRC